VFAIHGLRRWMEKRRVDGKFSASVHNAKDGAGIRALCVREREELASLRSVLTATVVQ